MNEALAGGAAQGPEEQAQAVSHQCTSEVPAWKAKADLDANSIEPAPCLEKLVANLRARLALRGGYVLVELADGTYMASRWNLCRPLNDLFAVSRFAQQVGA